MKTIKQTLEESVTKVYECAEFMEEDGDLTEDQVIEIATLTDKIKEIINQ